MFRYVEYPVGASVASYIKKCWVLDNSNNPNPLTDKQVLPNGCFNIAFISGEGIAITGAKVNAILGKGGYLCGQLTSSINIHLYGNTKIFLVQFYPWSPLLFMKDPLYETADSFIPIALTSHSLNLNFDIADEKQIMNYFNSGAFIGNETVIKPAMNVCQLIRRSKGNIAISELADQTGWSNRYLETVIKSALGLSPKEYAGIIRIRSLIDRWQIASGIRFSNLALEEGFYDQAHFIKTFKTMLNVSPGKFRKENYILTNSGISY
ncbi:helix-turn-helix domain-containing protein [Chitinophaga silvatica]|nr:helix-turn-helix domain-containing protein [Chitinophaga silvatica]